MRQVSLQGIESGLAEVHVAVFETLGLLRAYLAAFPVDIVGLQPAHLTGAQSTVQHQQEPGAVHPPHAAFAGVIGDGFRLDFGQEQA